MIAAHPTTPNRRENVTDILYAFPVANGGVKLCRDREEREPVATIFDRNQLGEYYQASDGWSVVNYKVEWIA